jgi:hypothetical protein
MNTYRVEILKLPYWSPFSGFPCRRSNECHTCFYIEGVGPREINAAIKGYLNAREREDILHMSVELVSGIKPEYTLLPNGSIREVGPIQPER